MNLRSTKWWRRSDLAVPSSLFFPDTTVITSFAIIRRMDLLNELVNGNGSWCATVADECRIGARKAGLEDMGKAGDTFGSPIYPDAAEQVDLRVLQSQMMGPGDTRSSHLGESETIAIISGRGLKAAFITDDNGARRHAKLQEIPTYSTWDILKLGVRTKKLPVEQFHQHHHELMGADRGHPPCGHGRASVEAWLEKS